MDTWYLLFDGTSADGMGQGRYIGRTTDRVAARKHYEKCRADPYSTGDVKIVSDVEFGSAGPWTEWESI